MDNYINLAELRKTAEAILVKMQDKLDEKISTDDFILNGEYDSDHNYKIELTNNKSFTIPASWVTDIAGEIASNVAYNEINDALSGITSFEVSVVSTLPTTGDSNTFYFLSKTGTTGDEYDEYMYINDQWEKIGTTAIDLSGYLKTTDIADWAKASTKPSYTASEVGAIAKTGGTMSGTLNMGTNSITFTHLGANYNQTTTLSQHSSKDSSGDYGGYLMITGDVRYTRTPNSNHEIANKQYVDNTFASITIPTNISAFTNDSGYLTSYTETDPVFAASAAAGITATDISNWNAKVSDDKTWNGVTLSLSSTYTSANQYVPVKQTNSLSGSASQIEATQTPTQYRIAKYDDNACLNSTTPAATDNSKKVATTAYVKTAISNIAIPAAQVQSDWNATSGMGVILNKPAYMTETELDTMLEEFFPTQL